MLIVFPAAPKKIARIKHPGLTLDYFVKKLLHLLTRFCFLLVYISLSDNIYTTTNRVFTKKGPKFNKNVSFSLLIKTYNRKKIIENCIMFQIGEEKTSNSFSYIVQTDCVSLIYLF